MKNAKQTREYHTRYGRHHNVDLVFFRYAANRAQDTEDKRAYCKQKPKYLNFLIATALFLIPTILLGFALKSLILPLLGSLLTFIVCSVVMIVFNLLLFMVFGLVDTQIVTSRIKRKNPVLKHGIKNLKYLYFIIFLIAFIVLLALRQYIFA